MGILVVALAGLACRMSVPWMPAALLGTDHETKMLRLVNTSTWKRQRLKTPMLIMEEKIDGHKDISECIKMLTHDDSIFKHDLIPAPALKQQIVDCAKAKLEHQARKKAEYGLRGSDQKAARLRDWLMRASSLLATEQFGRMTAAQLRAKLDAIQRLKLQGEKQVPKLSSRKPEVTVHMHAVTPAALQQLASARARESPAQSTSASSAVASARALEVA